MCASLLVERELTIHQGGVTYTQHEKGTHEPMRRRSSLVTTVVVVGIVAGLVVLVATQRFGSTPFGSIGGQSSPLPSYGTQYGQISAILMSPDNVTFQVVGIERGATRWLFHIRAQNTTKRSVTIMTSDHYFMLAGQGTPGTPVTASQIFLKLVVPAQSGLVGADIASHPALATSVTASGVTDGWLAADLTNFKYIPHALLYVYGTVSDLACSNPRDQNTCHPDTGYRTLTWLLV